MYLLHLCLKLFITAVVGIGWSIGAGGDCMSNNHIDCFECNTWDDPRCHDPFNYTDRKEDMPPLKDCEGCCVKMVQFVGTEHYQIRRTCTDNFDVNFFMVNHACMTEGHRHGHMCFCEEDECNAAKTKGHSFLLTLLSLFVVRFLSSLLICPDSESFFLRRPSKS